jgi:hypothetical protein
VKAPGTGTSLEPDTKEEPLVLILDDQSTWPEHVTELLNQEEVVELLRENEFVDGLVKHSVLRPVLEEIEEYVAKTPLAAYHCTKQLPEHPFAATGLRVLNFDEHHAQIRNQLRNHKLFTPTLFKKLDKRLREWRKHNSEHREKMLWVCVDRKLVFDPGAESFFKYFGGEAVYFSVMEDPELGPVFEQLGEPIVVEMRIASRDLQVTQELAFARTLVSHFANSINPEFFIEGREGYLSKAVGQRDIVAVHRHKDFVKKFGPNRKKR